MLTALRKLVGMALLIGLASAQWTTGQKPPADTGGRPSKPNLKLVTIGEAVTSSGRRGGFRLYASADGGDAEVIYFHFDSARDAKREVAGWLKFTREIVSKEQRKDLWGRVVGDRIVAKGRKSESGPEEFLIIRRNGSICYFVQSASLAVARQVEELIRSK